MTQTKRTFEDPCVYIEEQYNAIGDITQNKKQHVAITETMIHRILDSFTFLDIKGKFQKATNAINLYEAHIGKLASTDLKDTAFTVLYFRAHQVLFDIAFSSLDIEKMITTDIIFREKFNRSPQEIVKWAKYADPTICQAIVRRKDMNAKADFAAAKVLIHLGQKLDFETRPETTKLEQDHHSPNRHSFTANLSDIASSTASDDDPPQNTSSRL